MPHTSRCASVAISLLALLAAPAQAAITASGPSFAIADNPFDSSYPAIHNFDAAASASGGFAVVWDAQRYPGYVTTPDARFQRFTATGAPIGAAIVLTKGTDHYSLAPAVAADPRGGYVVVWYDHGGVLSGLFARRYDAAGRLRDKTAIPITAISSYSNPAYGNEDRPSVAVRADGAFVVGWSAGQDVYARGFSAAGIPYGPEFALESNQSSGTNPIKAHAPRLAFTNDGKVEAVFNLYVSGKFGEEGSAGVYLRHFGIAGLNIDPSELLSQSGVTPSITSNATGEFMVTWSTSSSQYASVVALRYAGPHAPLDSVPLTLSTGTAGFFPSAGLDSRGDSVVAWYADSHAVARVLDPSGFRLDATPEILDDVPSWDWADEPVMAMRPDGSFVVVWLGRQLRARVFSHF